MRKHGYGQQPSDITGAALGLGFVKGVRHLKSLSAGGSFWHTHDTLQLLFCLRGEFTYEFRDRAPVILSAGQSIVIPADTPHRHLLAVDPAGHRVELLIERRIERHPRFALASVRETNASLNQLAGQAFAPQTCSRDQTAHFAELDALAETASVRRLTEDELVRARMLLFQVILGNVRPPAKAQVRKSEAQLMSSAVDWLKRHATENIRIPRLVSYMGYSRARFFVLFRQHTGHTPSAWLTRHRIQLARTLLVKTNRSPADIARSCGFTSTPYFCTVFRQASGKTPLQWRQAARSEPRGDTAVLTSDGCPTPALRSRRRRTPRAPAPD